MDISSLASPSLTHCGPNLLKRVSCSVVYPSLESVPEGEAEFMVVQRNGAAMGRAAVGREAWLSRRAQLGGLASCSRLRAKTAEQKCSRALLRWPMSLCDSLAESWASSA